MKVNPQARIEVMHVKHGSQTIIKTWSTLVWEWFGSKHPDLPMIFEELKTTGKCNYTSDITDGSYYFKSLDKMTLDN